MWVLLTSCALSVKAEGLGPVGSHAAPEFYSNKTIELDHYRGRYIYLDFWASWCAPCKQSFPWMEQLHQQYHSKGLQIIAVNIDEHKKDAQQFLSEVPVSFINLYDPKGKIGKVLKVKKMPTSFLIDPKGNILFKHSGFDQEYAKKLDEVLAQLISEPALQKSKSFKE